MAALVENKSLLPFQEDFVHPQGTASFNALWKPFTQYEGHNAEALAVPRDISELRDMIRQVDKHDLPVRFIGLHCLSSVNADIGIMSTHMMFLALDEKNRTVTVGAGWQQKDLDKFLLDRGFATVTTTFGKSSIVGGALEGGFGWLSGQHGLALDNMLSAQVVLSDATVVECSASENADLFWGIKGTGGNLGIVTEATFKIYPQQEHVFWCIVTCPISSLETVLDTVASLHPDLDARAAISTRLEMRSSGANIMLRLFFNGTSDEAAKQFEPILAIPNIDVETRIVRYDQVSGEVDVLEDHLWGNRFTYTGLNLGSLSVTEVLQLCQETQEELMACPGLQFAVLGLDARNSDLIRSGGCDDAAFSARTDSLMCYIRAVWKDSAFDNAIGSTVKSLGFKWRNRVTCGPKAFPAFCKQGELTLEEAYGTNLAQLQALKKKYDPKCMWKTARTIE